MSFIDELKRLLEQEPETKPEPPASPVIAVKVGERPNPWIQKSPGFQQNAETGEVVEVRTVSRTVRVISESSSDSYRPALDYNSNEFQLEVVGSLGKQPLCAVAAKRLKEIASWEKAVTHNKVAKKDLDRYDKELMAWSEARRLWAENDVNFVHSLGVEIMDGEICVPDPYEGYMRPIKAESMSELRRIFE